MNPAAESWLKQATEDLRYARSALADGYFAWTCFACQQSAEKALKALLVEHEGTVEKTHRLLALTNRAERYVRTLRRQRAKLDTLNQYYAPTRYADLHDSGPPYEQYTEALATEAARFATTILRLVSRHLRGRKKRGPLQV